MISALVGFLFAFNAMLLTVPQRRRLIADLRRDGYTPRAVIAVLMFDAVVLGTIACAIGLLLGDELSIHLFHSNPGYLSSAFAVGSERVVNLQSIAISVLGGMGAASVAVLSPFKDIVSRNPLAAIETKEGTGGSTSWPLTLAGLVCLGGHPRDPPGGPAGGDRGDGHTDRCPARALGDTARGNARSSYDGSPRRS